MNSFDILQVSPDRPVLIAGPTASGKSALAMRIVARQGGVIINADALQVYEGWRILTARPSAADESTLPHALYGHVPRDADYSVGHWLRDITPMLSGARPVIVGGTGLYFAALTEGLANIPATPPDVRALAETLPLPDLLAGIDPQTAAGIDRQNRARVQRAWEVERSTGRPLRHWQAETAPPILQLAETQPILVNADRDWLNARIARRFDMMVDQGLLDEARAMHPRWSRAHPSSKAIGAPALMEHLNGDLTLEQVREAVIIGTRQYAKRQRTWFRARMGAWQHVDAAGV